MRLREDQQDPLHGGASEALVRQEVEAWAISEYDDPGVVVGAAAVDDDEDVERILVDFAVRWLGTWHVAEVWLEEGEITLIHDLGEGLPIDGAAWPWVDNETRNEQV